MTSSSLRADPSSLHPRGGTKLKILGGLVGLLVLAWGGMFAYGAATQVRQLRPAESLLPGGHAERTRTAHALDYSVATTIAAPPETVWRILTDAKGYTGWNSTLVKLEGPIALGSRVKLVTKLAPDRTFDSKVTTFDAPRKMVWEDGNPMFQGVRTYTLVPVSGGGTVFAMSETLSGAMLGMIEGSLPDFTASFETVAAELKKQAEGPGAAVAR